MLLLVIKEHAMQAALMGFRALWLCMMVIQVNAAHADLRIESPAPNSVFEPGEEVVLQVSLPPEDGDVVSVRLKPIYGDPFSADVDSEYPFELTTQLPESVVGPLSLEVVAVVIPFRVLASAVTVEIVSGQQIEAIRATPDSGVIRALGETTRITSMVRFVDGTEAVVADPALTIDEADELVLRVGEDNQIVGVSAGMASVTVSYLGFDAQVGLLVEDANSAPVISPSPPLLAVPGQTAQVHIVAQADVSPVSLRAVNLPSYVSLVDHGDGTATLAASPPADALSGRHVVTLVAADSGDPPRAATQGVVVSIAEVLAGVPAYARKMILHDQRGEPAKRRFVLSVKDPAIVVPTAEGAETVRVMLVDEAYPRTSAVTLADPDSWKGLGSPAGTKGYRYSGKGLVGRPCPTAIIKAGSFKIKCLGKRGPLPFDLYDRPLAPIGAIVEFGSEARYCVRFAGPESLADRQNEKMGTRKLVGNDAPAPSGCLLP